MLSPPPELTTPTTSPSSVTSGPPLLPGLTAASVWMASAMENPFAAGSVRSTPLTMPAETDPE